MNEITTSKRTLKRGARVHIMGIGGFGMSAIARVMHGQGYQVSGCDMQSSPLIDQLRKLSILIDLEHDRAHISTYNVEVLVVSSAIPEDHPEIDAAIQMGIPVFKRSDILAVLLAGKKTIAIAGTHGKTTTTAMTAHILTETGKDPSYMVGGIMANTGTNARAGSGDVFVVEADEYDGMFLGLHPDIAVVTSLEMDHPDMFSSIREVRALFREFVEQVPDEGLLIANHDSPETIKLVKERQVFNKPAFSYGLTGGMWRADELRVSAIGKMEFLVQRLGFDVEQVALQVVGEHNVNNALAALAVAVEVGVELKSAVSAMNTFQGVGRRFEKLTEATGVIVLDDYAHHPTAIKTTLDAVKARYPDGTIWAVWQPHTFSRTRALLSEFLTSFDVADHLIITDIYRSRDTETFGITAESLLAQFVHRDARHYSDMQYIADYIFQRVRPNDVVIVMSAGDATHIAHNIAQKLEAKQAEQETA